jgi:hypothetical protein
MQQLGTRTLTVDGVTVYADHADPLQFWCLPAPVALGRHQPGNDAAFTFIKFRPAAVAGGAKGGGFLTCEVNLRLPPATEQKILGQLSGLVRGGEPRLAVVPFDSGAVRCIALDLEGPGGTSAPDAPSGTFRAVEAIHGATTPSLAGDNTAAFSLSLSQGGATILEQAFQQGTAPVGAVYDLKYSILRPALQVTIHADYERIWQHFSVGLEAQVYWVRAGIDVGFEKLVADGAITIEVIDFTSEGDKDQKEKWALDFFKDNLLSKWFEPTLTPADVESRMAQPEALDAVLKRTRDMATPGGGGTAGGGQGDGQATAKGGGPGAGQTGGDASGKAGQAGTPAPAPPPAAKPEAPAAAARPAAVLKEVTRTPEPPPAGQAIAHQPAADGLQERVTVSGPPGWRATVDSQSATIVDGAIQMDLPAGGRKALEVRWPAAPAPTPVPPPGPGQPASSSTQETFLLFFEKDMPAVVSNFGPAHPVALAYAANTTTDQAFLTKSRVEGRLLPLPSEPRGADRLRAWLATLDSPRTVTLEGHASFEQFAPGKDPIHPEPEGRNARDRSLSLQRLAVGRAALRGGALVQSETARGHDDAKAAGTNDDPDWRVVKIKGRVAAPPPVAPPGPPGSPVGGTPAPGPPAPAGTATTGQVVIHGVLERPAVTAPTPTPTPTPTPNPSGNKTPNPDSGTTTPAPSGLGGSTPALVSFRLKFVEVTERKTITLRYNRTEAVQRTYAPQGFFGLLLGDLTDPSKHFVEVDLDDPFFRTFEVSVEAPVAYDRIGLSSIQVALDYGDPGAPASMKHDDMIFEAANPGRRSFTTFMSPALATAYRVSEQYHFRDDAGWDAEHTSYERPARDTADRTLVVNPHDMLGFLEVQVMPHRIDPGAVERIDVELSVTDPATGWVARRTITLRAGDAPQTWRARTAAPVTDGYTYRLVHHLLDGTVVQDDPVQTLAQTVAVDDPFDAAIEMLFIPLWDTVRVREVFVDVTYADPANRIERVERLTFTGADTAPRQLRLSIRDRKLRDFTYRVTLVGSDNSMTQRAPLTTRETLVGLPG